MNARAMSVSLGWIATVSVLGIGGVVAQEPRTHRPMVTVVAVREAPLVDRISVSGSLIARDEVFVNPQISGYVIRTVHAEIGDRVSVGEVLVQLDARALRADLRESDANVKRAEANVRQETSQIAVAKTTLTQANAALDRNVPLRESGTISQLELDDSISAATSAKASFSYAKDGLAVSQGELAQAHARREVARLNLARTSIESPVSGVISARSATVGAVAGMANTPLFTIIADGEIEFEADVPETELAGLNTGNPADIELAGGGRTRGLLRLVSPSVDPITRLGVVRVSLEDHSNIRAGSSAKGWLEAERRIALVVPLSAVHSSAAGDVVTVVSDGLVEKRTVTAGILSDGDREIVEGLEIGEQVLVRSGSFLRDGDEVDTTVVRDTEETHTPVLATSTIEGVIR